jgi:transposase
MGRRKYTREFKVSAVKLVQEQGYSVAQAARNLGVDPASLRDWIKKLSGADGVLPGADTSMQEELRRLRAENKRLLMEREILKKATAFFAKEQS